MSREITKHKVNGVNDGITILAMDDPSVGGASHVYRLLARPYPASWSIFFQTGPIKENGVNGLTNEALLAIVIDRLQGFQDGQLPCEENAMALLHLEQAMDWLHHRTRGRAMRHVEGTMAL